MKTIFKSMMIIAAFGAAASLTSCDDDDDDDITAPTTPSQSVSVSFKHMSGNDTLALNTTNFPYTNALGQSYRLTRLRYLVSNVTLHKTNGEGIELDEYFFVDFSKPETFNFNIVEKIPQGNYSGISYTFGFNEEDNIDFGYPELSAVNWNWPAPIGGGYHFMQLDGQFLDSNSTARNLSTHFGTARRIDSAGNTFVPNHFEVMIPNSGFTVGNVDFELEFTIDINEWYTNPTNWDFYVYGAGIMPNYDAQILLNTNGRDVLTVTKK